MAVEIFRRMLAVALREIYGGPGALTERLQGAGKELFAAKQLPHVVRMLRHRFADHEVGHGDGAMASAGFNDDAFAAGKFVLANAFLGAGHVAVWMNDFNRDFVALRGVFFQEDGDAVENGIGRANQRCHANAAGHGIEDAQGLVRQLPPRLVFPVPALVVAAGQIIQHAENQDGQQHLQNNQATRGESAQALRRWDDFQA